MLPYCPGAAAKAGASRLEDEKLVTHALLQRSDGDILPDAEDAAFSTSVRPTREDIVHMLQHACTPCLYMHAHQSCTTAATFTSHAASNPID